MPLYVVLEVVKMADKIVSEENLNNNKMLNAFMDLRYSKSVKYCSYVLERSSTKIELINGSKRLAMWDIEDDSVCVFDNLSAAEKRIAEKFIKLPALAGQLYKIKKELAKKRDRYAEGRAEIKEVLMNIEDAEKTKDTLQKLIKKLSYRYVDDWQGGGNTDVYNDNYLNYLMQTECVIESIMFNAGIDWVTYLLAKPKDKVYWDRYDDNELSKMFKIVPLSAQREGNLVTVTEEEYKTFGKNCDKAYKYAKQYLLNKSLRGFVPEEVVEVCWWEKNTDSNKFFITEKEEDYTPSTYREEILVRLHPKVKQQKSAKLSRLSVKIFFDESDKEGNVRYLLKKSVSQLGIIKWNYSKEQ